ncbi:MAG: hypothetical protein OSJ72_09970 [Lachnospiraceae bacterium]|nr:hypothetical protein [Lachnospiraceae bacterium]
MNEKEFEEQLQALSKRVLPNKSSAPKMQTDEYTLEISNNINTSYGSHSRLSELYIQLFRIQSYVIYLDFSKVTFIAANQFAVLGCILDTYRAKYPNTTIYFSNLNRKIKETIRKNGFNSHLGFEKLPDIYNTTIPYTIFDINEITEFEKYIILRIFSRQDIPNMSELVKSKIIDNILEIFNNVKEHTHSKKVYTCGQYFPTSSLLYFTIVDSGETIPYNVSTYCDKNCIELPQKPLEWAIAAGNTTREVNTPGGLGLSLLRDFIELNEGRLYIVSGCETYEQVGKKNRHRYMEHPFSGTIVTVAFNLLDESIYRMQSELPEIVF